MKSLIHFLLCLIAVPFWAAGITFMSLALLPILVAYRISPRSSTGNCWTYACPRWFSRGGYLVVRQAAGVKFLSIFSIPHVAWMPRTPPAGSLKQFVPSNRRRSFILPWFTLYFKGRVTDQEKEREAQGVTQFSPSGPAGN
jgi:hypothetical protein